MKKLDFSQTISIVANLGVIAGIVFLGLELQQNNRLLLANAEFALRDIGHDRAFRIIENEHLTDLMIRSQSGAELSETDQYRLYVMALDRLETFEWRYSQIQAGNLPDDGTLLQGLRTVFGAPEILGIPKEIFREAWDDLVPVRSPEFVRYVEANVIGEQAE
jgi:hypothetical protein